MLKISAVLIVCAIGCVLNVSAAQAGTERILYSFCSQYDCSDGTNPASTLINVGDTLYGTAYGGQFALGIAFSINRVTGAETVLHSFGNGIDGYYPSDALTSVDGVLYGTTGWGGTGTCQLTSSLYGCGTVFSIDPKTGTETVVYSFQDNKVDGVSPAATLIMVNGLLYGTTELGGTGSKCSIESYAYGCGTIFSLDPKTGSETLLYSFQARKKDGAYPYGKLIDVDGVLYGVTEFGGTTKCDCGTVFSFNLKTGAETVLHSFGGGSDGQYPESPLVELKGILYGTSILGGRGSCILGCGTVFSINIGKRAESIVHAFHINGTDGVEPAGGFIKIKSKLYGMTNFGGAGDCGTPDSGCGTIYTFDFKNGAERVLHSFRRRGGMYPTAGLVDVQGTLFGTTEEGGIENQDCAQQSCGTVFSFVP